MNEAMKAAGRIGAELGAAKARNSTRRIRAALSAQGDGDAGA